jgi:hypothetical protein
MTIESPATRRALTELALSSVLTMCTDGLEGSAGIVDLQLMDLADLADALAQIRGVTDVADGIVPQLQMIARDIENTIVAKVPRAKDGETPQKWTDVDGWRLERNGGGTWRIDSRKTLERLYRDLERETAPGFVKVQEAIDIVLTHIGSLDTSWRTTELEETLGGKIVQTVPVLDDAGDPIVYTRGAQKGQPKTREVKRSRIEAEDYGERTADRDTIRLHRGEATTEDATDG